MKIHKFPCYALLAAGLFMAVTPGHAETVIESNFGKKGEKDLPRIDEKDVDNTPLKYPTRAYAEAPSTLEVRKDGEGSYTEPLIVYTIGQSKESPNVCAGAKLAWDLRKAKLGVEGVYELTYTVIPLKLPIFGGRVQFTLVDPEGKPLKDVVAHISQMPTMGFRDDTFGITSEREKVKEGKAYEVKIRLDLTKQKWDAWFNGKSLAKKQALPEFLSAGYPKVGLGGISIGNEGGLADKAGGSYAIGALKLERVLSSD